MPNQRWTSRWMLLRKRETLRWLCKFTSYRPVIDDTCTRMVSCPAEWRTEDRLKSKRNAWINKTRTEELPMSSVLKYCLKPPPSQAYNGLSQPPPWDIQWQCFRWKKKILNAYKNETGLSVGRLCECSCSHWHRYFLMKTWNYIIYLNNSLKSCPLSEGRRWAWQHLTPANMCSASAAERSDSCTKGQRHVQHNELARRWCNIRNGFKMLSLATFPLIEPSWERHSVGFTLIASTMRVMNGKS